MKWHRFYVWRCWALRTKLSDFLTRCISSSFDLIPDFFTEYCRSNRGKPKGEVSHRFTSKLHSGEIIEICHICEFANVATYAILKNYITHYLTRKLLYVPSRANRLSCPSVKYWWRAVADSVISGQKRKFFIFHLRTLAASTAHITPLCRSNWDLQYL